MFSECVFTLPQNDERGETSADGTDGRAAKAGVGRRGVNASPARRLPHHGLESLERMQRHMWQRFQTKISDGKTASNARRKEVSQEAGEKTEM